MLPGLRMFAVYSKRSFNLKFLIYFLLSLGGETIKQINQQTGAHCELDRRPQSNPNEKVFVIRGNPEQIENAKRLIAEKLGMAGGTNGGPPAQFPMGGVPGGPGGPGPQQHFAPQNWGAGPAGFQQPWANPQGPHPNDPSEYIKMVLKLLQQKKRALHYPLTCWVVDLHHFPPLFLST